MHAWHSGAHQLGGAAGVAGGALDAVELEDESSGGGDGGHCAARTFSSPGKSQLLLVD